METVHSSGSCLWCLGEVTVLCFQWTFSPGRHQTSKNTDSSRGLVLSSHHVTVTEQLFSDSLQGPGLGHFEFQFHFLCLCFMTNSATSFPTSITNLKAYCPTGWRTEKIYRVFEGSMPYWGWILSLPNMLILANRVVEEKERWRQS